MIGGRMRDRRRFDDEHADEAARFLDRDIDRVDIAKAVIAGIDRLERVRAWMAVERALGRANGDPRTAVMSLLDEREQFLEEVGERPDRNVRREIEDVPAVDAEYPDRPDIETADDRTVFRSAGAFSGAVATDGGEKQ